MANVSPKRLAIYNFGIHVGPYDSPDVEASVCVSQPISKLRPEHAGL